MKIVMAVCRIAVFVCLRTRLVYMYSSGNDRKRDSKTNRRCSHKQRRENRCFCFIFVQSRSRISSHHSPVSSLQFSDSSLQASSVRCSVLLVSADPVPGTDVCKHVRNVCDESQMYKLFSTI